MEKRCADCLNCQRETRKTNSKKRQYVFCKEGLWFNYQADQRKAPWIDAGGIYFGEDDRKNIDLNKRAINCTEFISMD